MRFPFFLILTFCLPAIHASECLFEITFPQSFLSEKTNISWRQSLGQSNALKIINHSLPDDSPGTSVLSMARPSALRIHLPTNQNGPFADMLNPHGLIGKPGNPIFISFSFESSGKNPARQVQVSLAATRFSDDGGSPRISIARSGDGKLQLVVLPARQYYAFSTEIDSDGDKARRVVLRIDPGLGKNRSDKLTLWLDPESGLSEPPSPHMVLDEFPSAKATQESTDLSTACRSLAFNEVYLYSGPVRLTGGTRNIALFVGPIRFGSTWRSIQP